LDILGRLGVFFLCPNAPKVSRISAAAGRLGKGRQRVKKLNVLLIGLACVFGASAAENETAKSGSATVVSAVATGSTAIMASTNPKASSSIAITSMPATCGKSSPQLAGLSLVVPASALVQGLVPATIPATSSVKPSKTSAAKKDPVTGIRVPCPCDDSACTEDQCFCHPYCIGPE
jgi:hypothetical protein